MFIMHLIAPLFLHEIQLNFHPVYINGRFLRKDTLKVKLYQQMFDILAPTPLIHIVPVEYLFSQSRVLHIKQSIPKTKSTKIPIIAVFNPSHITT